MAQHRRLSSAHKDISPWRMFNMTPTEIFELLCKIRFGSVTEQVCPHCGAIDSNYFNESRRAWICKHCFTGFSLTSQTIFANCKLPTEKLFLMLLLFATMPNGISACQLQIMIEVSYKTAWVYLHKIREGLFKTQPNHKLSGVVHIDGGHFGGKPRSHQFRPTAEQRRKAIADKIKMGKTQGIKRAGMTRANYQRKKKNRRIVIVARQVEEGVGGVDTRIYVADRENETAIRHVVDDCVNPGTLIRTDEDSAYNFLSAKYEHETVCHKTEYCTIDGVSNNHAESFFSRLRRMEYGITHRMEARYMAFYAMEMAWREDSRFMTELEKLRSLIQRVFSVGISDIWSNYWQGNKLGKEIKI